MKAGNLIHIYKKLVHKAYYYVPDCPECGSHRTGRFFKDRLTADTDWIINDALKNGELMEPAPEIDPEKQLFCLDCCHTWTEPVYMRLLSLNEIEEEKRRRGTFDILKAKADEAAETGVKTGFIKRFFKSVT